MDLTDGLALINVLWEMLKRYARGDAGSGKEIAEYERSDSHS